MGINYSHSWNTKLMKEVGLKSIVMRKYLVANIFAAFRCDYIKIPLVIIHGFSVVDTLSENHDNSGKVIDKVEPSMVFLFLY